jgi:hypothetical protein
MQLRPDIDAVMDRTTRFCANGKTGDALVMVHPKLKGYPVKGLNEWQFPADVEPFLDECILAFEHSWRGREGLDDDLIPTMAPRYGIAEHSAFVTEGHVDFSANTSWPHPVLDDYGKLDSLELREDNTWLRMVIDGLAYLRAKGEGRFAVRLRGAMAPMDLANALRGNDMYMDIYEHPEELHRLLAFCVDAGQWFLMKQKEVVGSFRGGTLIGAGLWMPGNSIGHLSEDASVLCSPESYLEFGKPYTEQLVAPFDEANMHLHTAGVHAFEGIASIEKLQSFELAPDPKQPRGVRIYQDTIDLFQGRPMRLFINFDEIRENIGFLKQAKSVLHCGVDSIDEARAIVNYVRQELPIA